MRTGVLLDLLALLLSLGAATFTVLTLCVLLQLRRERRRRTGWCYWRPAVEKPRETYTVTAEFDARGLDRGPVHYSLYDAEGGVQQTGTLLPDDRCEP